MRVLLTAFFLVLSSLSLAAPMQTPAKETLRDIVVFGDSLSDNGNLYEYEKHLIPKSPPYYKGRFSNGPVWVERLAASYYGSKADNYLQDYAFGGAAVMDTNPDSILITLQSEIESYLAVHQRVAEDNLYIVWIGANNYFVQDDATENIVANVNDGIKRSLERLADAGAKHILVLNLPDLGKTPFGRDLDMVDFYSHSISLHNQALTATLAGLKLQYPNVQWLTYDVNSLVNELIMNPSKYGFTNTTETCYQSLVPENGIRKSMLAIAASIQIKENPDPCSGFLFFDSVHPTAPAHQIMANVAHQLLDDNGLTFAEHE